MLSDAGFSSCWKYRHWLFREWDASKPILIWVMMNPSTADHRKNDATISKVIRYSKAWGYGGVLVLNIYAWRSRDQKKIGGVGKSNDWWLKTIFTYAKAKQLKVVCAWGVNHLDRSLQVRKIAQQVGVVLYCLEHAKNGEPKHPLYLKGTLRPVRMMH